MSRRVGNAHCRDGGASERWRMLSEISERLRTIQLGPAQCYGPVAVFPLCGENGLEAPCPVLGEALRRKWLRITEVSLGGTVAQLKVTNRGAAPVLLLDGEEVAGMKQNRVLNTSVLAPVDRVLAVPVSCSEQGRWGYLSETGFESGALLTHRVRACKTQSVSASLTLAASFHADQAVVMSGLAEVGRRVGLKASATTLREVLRARRQVLNKAVKAFPLRPRQLGLLVVVVEGVVGFDLLPHSAIYARLHEKLLRSYLLEAMAEAAVPVVVPTSAGCVAQAFLDQVDGWASRSFSSVGLGEDHRLEAEGFVGSALTYQETVIHLSGLRLDPPRPEPWVVLRALAATPSG